MCGIVGLYLKNPRLEPQLGQLFEPMLQAMTDRGPDSAGFAGDLGLPYCFADFISATGGAIAADYRRRFAARRAAGRLAASPSSSKTARSNRFAFSENTAVSEFSGVGIKMLRISFSSAELLASAKILYLCEWVFIGLKTQSV